MCIYIVIKSMRHTPILNPKKKAAQPSASHELQEMTRKKDGGKCGGMYAKRRRIGRYSR